MFTGIIQELGTIVKIVDQKATKAFTIEAAMSAPGLKIGDSICVDGCCLTVIEIEQKSFKVEAVQETLTLSLAGKYQENQKVNLENSLAIGDKLHGHFVTGHVDFLGKVLKLSQENENTVLEIAFPANMARFFAMKGSTTINGVSLTISKVNQGSFEVTLIPHTLKVTNLGDLKTGSEVNIEVDLLARYIENLLGDKEQEANYFYLQERGLI